MRSSSSPARSTSYEEPHPVVDTISGPAKRDRRSGSLIAALLLTWGIIGAGGALADPTSDAAEDPPYMSGNAPEMTSGRPARGGPRAVAGRPPARGFIDWGGRPQDPSQATPGGRPVEVNATGRQYGSTSSMSSCRNLPVPSSMKSSTRTSSSIQG